MTIPQTACPSKTSHIAIPPSATTQEPAPSSPATTWPDRIASRETPDIPKAETDEFFAGLRELIRTCGADVNKHDLVTVAITACIWEGFNTRKRIVGALTHLGFDRGHVCITLGAGTGSDPERHQWYRDDQGVFSAVE